MNIKDSISKPMTIKEAIVKVKSELSKMSHDEFMAELEKHKDGDFAKIIRYSGALDIVR